MIKITGFDKTVDSYLDISIPSREKLSLNHIHVTNLLCKVPCISLFWHGSRFFKSCDV